MCEDKITCKTVTKDRNEETTSCYALGCGWLRPKEISSSRFNSPQLMVPVIIGVRARCDLGGRRPVCPKKLRSAPLLDCRNQLFTPSKCTKKHAFTIVERHKIVRNRNTVFRTSHTLCRFTRCSNDRVTKQATRSSN